MKRALAARAADTYVLGSDEKIGTASRYGCSTSTPSPRSSPTSPTPTRPRANSPRVASPASRALTQTAIITRLAIVPTG
jgi:hypothetical protein